MKILRDILLITTIISLIVIACSGPKQSSSLCVNGHIIGQDFETFALVTTSNDTLVLPKSADMTPSMKIFLHDSVWVRYSVTDSNVVVDEVILIAHKQPMSNVDELFVGCWNDKDSSLQMTFNSDQTTDTAGQRWLVSGKQVFLHSDDASLVYDIVRVDEHTMTLCHADHTLHLHRVNQ